MSPGRWMEVSLLLVAVAFLPGAGCGLFETREPVLADQEDTVWVPPSEPEIVVENLEAAFEAGIFNDYVRALTDDFVFIADQADVDQIAAEFPDQAIYEDWDRQVETEVAETISNAADSLRLTLGDPEREDSPQSVLLKYDYTLSVFRPSGRVDYEGEAWFRTRLSAGEWLIFEWEDIATSPSALSWGLLKGRNRLL